MLISENILMLYSVLQPQKELRANCIDQLCSAFWGHGLDVWCRARSCPVPLPWGPQLPLAGACVPKLGPRPCLYTNLACYLAYWTLQGSGNLSATDWQLVPLLPLLPNFQTSGDPCRLDGMSPQARSGLWSGDWTPLVYIIQQLMLFCEVFIYQQKSWTIICCYCHNFQNSNSYKRNPSLTSK